MPAKSDLRSRVVTANGAAIPALGFGTYSMSMRDMLRMIPAALDAGFRHIDAAQIYGNEEALEKGSRVPRFLARTCS